jgi:hypothetical protein
MLNREIYIKDPVTTQLRNNGVAKVVDAFSTEDLLTLRYELETFVCEGEYEKGMERILRTFLDHLDSGEQPGVWVSGFFGSGKSHLVKVLRALWVDYTFPEDQAKAQGLVDLPDPITDLLRELSTAGRRNGGLHAASGTLGAGAQGNVRPALLRIIFRSAGLPEAYPQARFVMWLKKEGLLDAVLASVEQAGRQWEPELGNMYVSRSLAEALLAADPGFASDTKAARTLLREQFPNKEDVSNKEMVDAIREALTEDDQFPLTLIVLDEVQQYINEYADRTYQIQELVETCSADFEGQLMFIGTGQTALAGTPNLQKLMARFTIPIQLSDTDVDVVVRKNILAKKPEAQTQIKKVMADNSGEVSRHLLESEIGYCPEDEETLIADYPLLPVRRRFWERCLRSLDPTGTKSQLRTQLSTVLQGARRTAENELGCVVAGDFVFDENASSMLQTGILSREVYERIMELKAGNEDEQFKARICALVFLIGKLPQDLAVQATENVLADLLVEDLRKGSGPLRQRLPALLEALVQEGLLMQIEDEYRLQTREGSAWNDEYRRQIGELQGDSQKIASLRVEALRSEVRKRLSGVRKLQGRCKEPREPELYFGSEAPNDQDDQLYVWVRDGWDTEDKAVLTDARAAGNQSATLFAFIPRNNADELRSNLVEIYATQVALDIRGTPSTPEGSEARNAIVTRQGNAERKLIQVVNQILSSAQVFQGGGQEISSVDLVGKVKEGLDNSLTRLYPRFGASDHEKWSQVITRAKNGDGDALSAVDHSGDADQHEVCKSILQYVGPGKKGADIRSEFSGKGYGWPRDAIDGGLYALLATGHLLATDKDGKPVELKKLTQGQITRTSFKQESVTVTPSQKIKVRKLLQELGLSNAPGEETNSSEKAVGILQELGRSAGGEPPRPELPSTQHLQELASLYGNELLIALAEKQEVLTEQAQTWKETGGEIESRWERWETLQQLLQYAEGLPEAKELQERVAAVREERQLLYDPNPVTAICSDLTQVLRTALNEAQQKYSDLHGQEMGELEEDSSWSELDGDQRGEILQAHDLAGIPTVATGTEAEVLSSLVSMSLSTWRDRIAALPQRFEQARLEAAQRLTPTATYVHLPSGTLNDEADVQAWLEKVKTLVEEKIKEGPIVI